MLNRRIVEDELKLNDIYDLVSKDASKPNFPQGKTLLCIKRCEVKWGYTDDNKLIKIICEDDLGKEFVQVFSIKNGISNNLAKFICEVLGYEPEGEFNINELEGKTIEATIAHYYNDVGVGYANIVFCEPALML